MKVVEQQPNNHALSRIIPGELPSFRRVALYATLCAGFFLLGFVPMWFKADQAIEQRDAAQRELRLRQLQGSLGAAIVDVQRGDYEPARQTMSDFYTSLRRLIDSSNDSVLSADQRQKLTPLLQERDEVITMLARSDSASVQRLSSVYTSYLKLTSNG